MLLQVPPESPYDWRGNILGFPVRVAWTFWVIAAAWGYEWARGLDRAYAQAGFETPGLALLLAIWVAAMLVSILVHEFGHALAFRWYGIRSQVVLYHFGGLAIPEGFGSWRGARLRRLKPTEDLVVALAGPAAQLLLAFAVVAVAVACGYRPDPWIANLWMKIGLPVPQRWVVPTNASIAATISFLVTPSIFWALVNLAPILPLDGGRAAQSIISIVQGGQGWLEASWLSVVTGALLGMWQLQTGDRFLGMMFLILAFSNFQTIQTSGMGRPW
jgi:Zn-dependent protease